MATRHTTRNVSPSSVGAEELEDNPVYQEILAETMANIVPEGYVEEQVSFPPYWKPEPGTGWRGTIIALDQRAKDFPRFIIESATTLDCRVGRISDGEIMTITPGMNFSVGAYAALPLERYRGLELAVLCVKQRKGLPPNDESEGMPRDMWVWKVFVHPEVRKLLDSQRKEDMAFVREAQRIAHRKHLEELARANVEEGRKTRLVG